jgi:hypothetical protein
MRCAACNANLTDFESSIRSDRTGNYLDLCSPCLSYIREVIVTSENFLLYNPEEDDLDTQFDRSDEVALAELLEDDTAAGVDAEGQRISDGDGRGQD